MKEGRETKPGIKPPIRTAHIKASAMLDDKSIEEFRNSGMLWFVNSIIHVFGWAIVIEYDNKKQAIRMYPARTKFRGFDEKSNTEGYIKISKYMKENAEDLYIESKK